MKDEEIWKEALFSAGKNISKHRSCWTQLGLSCKSNKTWKEITLKENEMVTFTPNLEQDATSDVLPVNFNGLAKFVQKKGHFYSVEEVEREIQIDEEEQQEEEPTTPIGIHISRQSSIRSHEEQQQQRQARGKRVNFQTIDEDEPVRQPFPAMPPPSGRAVSHVWSYFTKEPTENPDIFLCTCQICESQGVKPLVAYNFARGGGTGSFNKHLVKKHGITKETHAASGSGTTSGSGSRQTQWDIPSTDMMEKWKAYFTEFPYIYGIATILDPCFKTEVLTKVIGLYYQSLDRPPTDVHNYVGTCKKYLAELYDYYASVYNPKRDTSRRANVSARPSYYNSVIANIMSQDDSFVGSSSSSTSYLELDSYLIHHFEIDQGSYNILEWWKEKSVKFLILSRIAKDILAIPASTIASESAFSAGRRVLDEKRSRLAPKSIQICVCKKDWDQAEIRTQGLRNDDDQDDDDDPWMMMDTSVSSSRGESAEASNQPHDDDEDE
ncbi:uncharacterized protein LOC130799505 isoform X2 [Amaranthus tricolor]|uniref:uncharacterized protein LOC130799505 isoform X2 n=1 Tax=Amaranthus tricolor TaxID=29722 RepID=UPI0025863D1E|nr:uncharacterized protein LOC130799505 isoform X2 [Amaranthus tricolor]